METLENVVSEFTHVEAIRYADPIAWNIETSYEKNTVVIDGTTAYISMQPVRAGITLDNAEYWQPVFDFSDLPEEYETMQNRYYIFIGDSFAEGWTPDGVNTGYPVLFKNYYNLASDHIYISAIGGTGFTTNNSFLNQLQALYDQIEREKITDIYVMGGRNDYGQPIGTITAARNIFINYAKSAYPNATVHVGFIGKSFERSSGTAAQAQYDVFTGYSQKIETTGARYLYGIETCLNDSALFSSDMKHPTQEGQESILDALISIHDSGTFTFNRKIGVTITPESSNITLADVTGVIECVGRNVNVIMFPMTITLTDAVQMSADKYNMPIGNIPHTLSDMVTYTTYNACTSAVVNVLNSGGFAQYYTVPAVVTLTGNKLRVILTGTADAHNNYLNGPLKEIQLGGFRISFDSVSGE